MRKSWRGSKKAKIFQAKLLSAPSWIHQINSVGSARSAEFRVGVHISLCITGCRHRTRPYQGTRRIVEVDFDCAPPRAGTRCSHHESIDAAQNEVVVSGPTAGLKRANALPAFD